MCEATAMYLKNNTDICFLLLIIWSKHPEQAELEVLGSVLSQVSYY